MPEPTVACVMLTADRPAMARKAVECFRAQTYQDKWLICLDNSDADKGVNPCDEADQSREAYFHQAPQWNGGVRPSIGKLRNQAISLADMFVPDILIHFDDDDWSHPNRIAEQVALLQSSGADVVGYRELLFWRGDCTCAVPERDMHDEDCASLAGEAWLYRNPNPGYALGTSLCYWRRVWEHKPFPPTSHGEDVQFCTGLKCLGVRGIGSPIVAEAHPPDEDTPRMVARIHPGNTSSAYRPEALRAAPDHWQRVPEWDQHCRAVMEGA